VGNSNVTKEALCQPGRMRRRSRYVKKVDLFGELGFFFLQPRLASVWVSTETAEVWELSQEDLFEAAQESSLGDVARDVLRDAEKDKNGVWTRFINTGLSRAGRPR
jgi:CRP-like cAMP-binding protein